MAAKKTDIPSAKKMPAKKSAPKKVKAVAAKPRPSIEVIARAAYLNYRHRIDNDLPGDPNSDWLEAQRQHFGPI